jgi:hypothetical protein
VSGPASYLRQIPDDFTLAAAIIIGSVILVGLVLFHGAGIHWILTFHKRGNLRLRSGRPHISGAVILFGAAVFLLLSLHIIGVLTWAFALTHLGLISDTKNAVYFCANAYTTLGYGEVDLDSHYRIISPIIGISGLFTFAWTTSALVTIVTCHNALVEQLENERAKQKELRFNLKQANRTARAGEHEAMRDERIELAEETAGASLQRHWQLWREERRKLKSIRKNYRAETNSLHDEERNAENNLGVPPTDLNAPPPADKPPIPPKS